MIIINKITAIPDLCKIALVVGSLGITFLKITTLYCEKLVVLHRNLINMIH